MNTTRTLFCFLFILSISFELIGSSQLTEDLKNQAEQVLPSRQTPYQMPELQIIFQDLLTPEPLQMLTSVYDLWSKKPELNFYTPSQQVRGLRCLWINAKLLLSQDDLVDHQKGFIYQFLAAPALPYKAPEEKYTFPELLKIFDPILGVQTNSFFKTTMGTLLDTGSGTPKHTGEVLTDAYRCLLGKCIYALTQSTPDSLQKDAMLQLFAFPTHKKILIRTLPDLASQIPCPACAGRATMPSYRFNLKD